MVIMNDNISKLNIRFLHENQTYDIPLFDAKFAESPDIKKITVSGRQYFYEENAKAPESVNNLLKSLSEDTTFKTEKKLVSYISKETKIAQMSITNDIYELGKDRLISRNNTDSKALKLAKETLYNELINTKPGDKKTILTIINKTKPPLNQLKALFEIADDIKRNGNPKLAHSIRKVVRPFDLQPIIQQVPEIFKEHYIDPEKGKIIAEKLKLLFATEKYEKFYDPMEFIDQLTLDLRDIANDQHLAIESRKRPEDKKVQGAVAKSSVKNDIGYFEITKFKNPNDKTNDQPIALLEVKQALDQLREANPKAIIIDLTKNDGGSPYMMAYIASHFIKADQELAQNVYRDEIKPEELRSFPIDPIKTLSEKELPLEKRMLKQPIFILTSHYSLSAAEALTYHLKEHRQATIIGENTGGAAHVCKLFEVSPEFNVAVSFGDYVLKSGEPNWEAKGLSPDIQANGEDAYQIAEKQINDQLKH